MKNANVVLADHRRPLALLALAIGLVAAACASPAGGPGATQTGANPPAAGGATTFHLVVSDGPKAGTYDLTSTDPGACRVADEGYFIASYMLTTQPGLDYVEGNLQPSVTGLKYGFDVEDTAKKLIFIGDGEVTINVDDRGSTATMNVVSESNIATQPDGTVLDTGRAELTVECASVQRPGG